ncbi:acyl-CoA synthetase [Tropicimonas sp. TH_r6]|nr:acyl-CoA synthetase [Tropicimonas sp. TH_r6]MDV7141193.1 acyl-CoA synthetase [Tropicimonas sp. TH_r6]
MQEVLAARRDLSKTTDWEAHRPFRTIHEMLSHSAAAHGNRPVLSFQLTSSPQDPGRTLSYSELLAQVTQCANLFRAHGVGPGDVVALVMPNCCETVVAMLGAMTAGIVNPINPLLEAEQISAILRETNAKVVVTLRAIPKTDIAQKAAQAVAFAPNVTTLLEVDLAGYLPPLKAGIVNVIRPRNPNKHHARIFRFSRELAKHPSDRLTFEDGPDDRMAALFHTGGTTGAPKVAQHMVSGVLYQGWMFADAVCGPEDVLLCPLPLFHVMAGHVALGLALQSGAQIVLPTPQGYRGDGVFDNYWKLVERYRASIAVVVPTAVAALMQRPVDADVSTLRFAVSGSAPMPMELFRRFEDATGLSILEGYGMTENTCMVSITPGGDESKIGSVGLPVPFCKVRVLDIGADDETRAECRIDEIGEICVSSPGVLPGRTYIEAARNAGLYADETWLRTGDLGRLDADGYLWITGRAKDLIIRGGHNIDPAEIEEALIAHHGVALVAAIGQPDIHSGELPCAYVELVDGATISATELQDFAREHIWERAATPKYIEIVEAMPLTMVGKIFKPELRKRAIARVFDAALSEAGLASHVVEVVEDSRRGMVAVLTREEGLPERDVAACLEGFVPGWRWQDET